jgi:hypothetical protein
MTKKSQASTSLPAWPGALGAASRGKRIVRSPVGTSRPAISRSGSYSPRPATLATARRAPPLEALAAP